MPVIKPKYEQLLPKGALLGDVVVLAQAWKKSHAYIRRHNWYSDVLELDSSTVDLESRLAAWAVDLSNANFRPQELLLVPAPKNARWEFRPRHQASQTLGTSIFDSLNVSLDEVGFEPTFDDWQPKTNEKPATPDASATIRQKLRPLAHLTIRDQTLATAVMMCLAEAIETIQGDPTEKDANKARESGTVSYGNRLHCQWIKTAVAPTRANFSWGNGRTYRQYFQDYRTFLARPRRVCAELTAQLPTGREVYVVALDLKSFYDRIDRAALLRELRRFEAEYRQRLGLPDISASDVEFWQRATRIFDWRWRDQDHGHAELVCGSGADKLELGLPQGLVAAGFLANAYLIEFDRCLHKATSQVLELKRGIKVRDYCRYVDDLRIVVDAPTGSNGIEQSEILKEVEAYVMDQLEAHRLHLGAEPKLQLSEDKCTITPYRSISTQSNLSVLMDVLNAELSGTFDLESLVQTAGGLDGLLWMSEQIESSAEPPRSRLSLATIAVQNTDVRDDTVKRFAATRIAQLMRHRLAMTDSSALETSNKTLSDRVTSGMALAHEFESTARKLIRCWAENPALVLLLRCGLDLYPHPKLLAPVVEALSVKLFSATGAPDAEKSRQIRMAEYVAADLFRAGAVETGLRDAEEYPETIDIPGYREDLGVVARRVISERPDSPWYLLQQAHLYLASIGDVSLAMTNVAASVEVENYRGLQRALLYESMHSQELSAHLPLALVAQQLHPNPRRFGVWLAEGLRLTNDEGQQAAIVLTVALNRSDLLAAALATRSSRAHWRRFVPASVLESNRKLPPKRTASNNHVVRPLLRIMLDSDNAFSQENGVLMLARALLLVDNIREQLSSGLSADEIFVKCEDWSRIHSLPLDHKFLSASIGTRKSEVNPLYATPPWVDDDKAWLYGLGRILRAALTGEFDYTSRHFLITEEIGRYSGLRSTWFKRRFGLLNSGRGLLDEPGPLSPWLSGFLSTLLQWPGVEFRTSAASTASDARTPEELLAFLEGRISVQRALFGVRSKTPIYVLPTDDRADLEDRPVRIAIVQTLRPRRDEFDVKDPLHWTPGVLAEHRRHLAEVCRLAFQKLRTWTSAQPSKLAKDEEDMPIVDVVLFPELAVHPEHVFLLRRLSDKLKSNVFAGLTFTQSKKIGAPINQGLWLIRSASKEHGRNIQYAWQGKCYPTKDEEAMGVKGYRPHITLVELPIGTKSATRLAAAICYDATNLDLVADLRDKSDIFLVAALNKDVPTFDNMVAALHFHMYQPVVLANSGEFGGSTAQAPLPKHERLIAHVHGNNQVAVSVFEIDPAPFKSTAIPKAARELKTPPAGYTGRP